MQLKLYHPTLITELNPVSGPPCNIWGGRGAFRCDYALICLQEENSQRECQLICVARLNTLVLKTSTRCLMTKIHNLALLGGMWGFISLLSLWKFSWFALSPPSPMLWDSILSNSTNKIQRLTCCCISSGLVQILCYIVYGNLLILLCSIHKNAYFYSHNWLDCFKCCKFTSSLLLLEEDLNGIYHIFNSVLSSSKRLLPPGRLTARSPKNVNIFLFPSPPNPRTSSVAQLSVLLSQTATVRPKQLQKASLCLVTSAESRVKNFISKD